MLQNGKSNVIENLDEKFNESIYLILAKSAQEKLIQHGIKTKLMNSLKLTRDHILCLIALSLRIISIIF
jgi:hypothetical protein